MWWTILVVSLVLIGLGLLPLRHPARQARILYLNKERTNYVRFRPNPGYTWGKHHYCRSGKGTCRLNLPVTVPGQTYSKYSNRDGM